MSTLPSFMRGVRKAATSGIKKVKKGSSVFRYINVNVPSASAPVSNINPIDIVASRKLRFLKKLRAGELKKTAKRITQFRDNVLKSKKTKDFTTKVIGGIGNQIRRYSR